MPGLAVPVVSALTTGVLLILQMLLLLAAAMGRRRTRQALGEGDDPGLLRALRRHGNLAENAAIFLVGVTLYEMLGGRREWVEALCAAFIAARLSHAIGLSMPNTVNAFRVLGVFVTVVVNVTVAVRLVTISLPQLGL
jgi:uncharacterized membrane protein YecN with MAPEG domain